MSAPPNAQSDLGWDLSPWFPERSDDPTAALMRSGDAALPFNPVLAASFFLTPRRPPALAEPFPVEPVPAAAAGQPLGRLEVGAILDKYRIEGLIGTGGFATVYRAKHLLLDMTVAVKLLRPEVLQRRPGLAALLCEEARFAARINHPNVVRVFDVTHTPLITYVVLEFIEGRSLASALSDCGRLSPREVLNIGMDIASGLQAGLDQGLIHRDIKPANVLLSAAGSAKIVDFGLAYRSRGRRSGASRSGSTLQARSVLGTPGYVSPEQAVNPERVDFRADLYSLGATLYHAAVGRPPFPLDDVERCLSAHQQEPVPLPTEIVPGFPAELAHLLLWFLAKPPGDRPGSYGVALAAMGEVLTRLSSDGKESETR